MKVVKNIKRLFSGNSTGSIKHTGGMKYCEDCRGVHTGSYECEGDRGPVTPNSSKNGSEETRERGEEVNADSPRPAQLLKDGAETYIRKNRSYGDSWKLGPELIWKMMGEEPITLSSLRDVISFALYVRRADKFIRAFNGEFKADGDLDFESIFDSHMDEGNYSFMHASINEE